MTTTPAALPHPPTIPVTRAQIAAAFRELARIRRRLGDELGAQRALFSAATVTGHVGMSAGAYPGVHAAATHVHRESHGACCGLST